MADTRHWKSELPLVWILFAAGGAWLACSLAAGSQLYAEDNGAEWSAPRCEVTPVADQQVVFSIDGVEKTRWHFGNNYPRPFFYPFNGPSGETLTRMGHPGAPDHDHHQSIWFAHNKVDGLDFWGNGHQSEIRQKQWLCFQDGSSEGIMAVLLGWYAADGRELMEQQVVAGIMPVEDGQSNGGSKHAAEHGLEIQFTLRPAAGIDAVALDKTNFGFLAVRVAKGISAAFGNGELNNSEGAVGESECFAKPARWMDYSGPVAARQPGSEGERQARSEGITFFDHPSNPRYPTHWHVRNDGWMGAAYGLQEAHRLTAAEPLTLRYFLFAHREGYDAIKAQRVADQFAQRPAYQVVRAERGNLQFEVKR